jgi:hypothetical protein
MTVLSNLYAEKLYSEHPIAIWHLDDNADYISLISDENRNSLFDNTANWIVTNADDSYSPSASVLKAMSPYPFPNENILSLEIIDENNSIELETPGFIGFDDLDLNLKTFALGVWVYSESRFLTSLSIGYKYSGGPTIFKDINLLDIQEKRGWFFVSETFEIPTGVTNEMIDILIKINTSTSGSSTSDYRFSWHGLTMGQLCEEYHAESLGKQQISLPSSINLNADGAVVADAYGLSDKNGYYIVANNNLVARHGSIPLVFGSSGSVELIPHEQVITTQSWQQTDLQNWSYWEQNDTWQSLLNFDQSEFIISAKPSIIFPGCGFLNESGRNQNYTVEFWLNIDSNATTPKRIFGPISSTDGLYVENAFLTLVIGNNFVSHYVGEWFRPMLIHIRLIKDSAVLLVNGEEVGQLSFITNELVLPEEFTSSSKSNDWVGFYAYKDNIVDPIILGSFSIFPYSMSTLVAKSHYVYGQGVPLSSEVIDSYYGGTSVEIDYSVSKYNINKSYPLNLSWQQADIDNLNATDTSLKIPDFSLPTFNLGTKTLSELELDNAAIQDDGEVFFSLNPNSTWNSINSSIYFNNLSFMQSSINAIYGVFEFTSSSTDQTLICLFQDDNNYLKVRRLANSNSINYVFSYNGTITTIASAVIPLHEFVTGFEFSKLLSNNILGLSQFLSNPLSLKLYLGNDLDSNKFTGKIYTFGISTLKNSLEIDDHFSANGLANINAYSSLIPHIASYTLSPFEEYGKFFLDISVAGYWRDYLPISTLMSQVIDASNNTVNDLDYVQFNIDYPSPSDTPSSGQVYWTNPSISNSYLTSNASVRSYVAFDYTSNGYSKPDEDYTDIDANQSRVLDLNNTTWTDKRFELVDGYLIYPDKNVNLSNMSLIYFVNFKVKSILKKNIFLRKLEFAARTLNYNSNTPIGTKHGIDIYPFRKVGFYTSHKGKNPLIIDKDNTPYLYLTRKSGLELRNGVNDIERGISIPISSVSVDQYSLSALQMFTRCDLFAFPENPIKIFEINHKNDSLDFYIKANSSSGKRGLIFAKLRSNGTIFTDLSYYLNGKLVGSPVIDIQQWYSLGISFNSSLSFDNYAGSIILKYLMMFNNISFYQGTPLQVIQRLALRTWQEVEDEQASWQLWENEGDWNNVLIRSRDSRYIVNPSEVYKTYIGNRTTVIDDFNNDFRIVSNSISSYENTSWQEYIITPA